MSTFAEKAPLPLQPPGLKSVQPMGAAPAVSASKSSHRASALQPVPMPLPAAPAMPPEPAAVELPPTLAPALPPAVELVPPLPAELELPAVPALALLPAVPVDPLEPDWAPAVDAVPAEPGFELGSFPEEQAANESKATEAKHTLFMVRDLETYRDQWNAVRQRKMYFLTPGADSFAPQSLRRREPAEPVRHTNQNGTTRLDKLEPSHGAAHRRLARVCQLRAVLDRPPRVAGLGNHVPLAI